MSTERNSAVGPTRKVVIAQYRLLHYRTALFEKLRVRCLADGIELRVLHGQPTRRELSKRDTGVLPWADEVRNWVVEVGPRDLVWQPFPDALRDADLVILMQENRLLSNYPWLFGPRSPKVAYWGHGRNFQSYSPGGLRERWKRYLVGRVDWWFAYTDMTRAILEVDGFPASKITVLDNAIDSDGFNRDLAAVTDADLAALRAMLCVPENGRVGLFCGSLYSDKRLQMMIDAADLIRESVPDFCLVVVGDGPESALIASAIGTRPWMHWVGVKKGIEKAGYFRIAHFVLNPGAVGLHVLDAFCAGIPMVTTADARHGPEIAYLVDGTNGLVCNGDATSYAADVLTLLADRNRYDEICRAAADGARRYTLSNMVDRFHAGIVQAIGDRQPVGVES